MTHLEPVPAAGTPEERSTEFVPVQGGTETSSAEHLLATAYFLMWAALIAFIWLTWKRQNRIDGRLAELGAALEKAGKKS